MASMHQEYEVLRHGQISSVNMLIMNKLPSLNQLLSTKQLCL